MTSQEPDGIDDAIEGAIRLAAIAGARVGAEIMRGREELRRQAEIRDDQTRRELAQRLTAEKAVAVAQLGQIHEADWWDRADAQRIGQTYASAVAWAPEAPEALRAQQTMMSELRRRYDVDVKFADRAGVGGQVAAGVAEWERRLAAERSQQVQHRITPAGETVAGGERQVAENDAREEARHREAAERAEAGLLAARAEQERAESELPQYDSADRRDVDAGELTARGIPNEVVSARLQADTGFAQPATGATAGQGRRRQKTARRSGAKGVSRDNHGRGR